MLENKIVRLLLSVCIAFVIWFYVITVVTPEQDRTFTGIPVYFQGEALLEERGLMVVSDKAPTVALQLYGKRSDLSKVDSSNIYVTVDLSKIGEAGTYNFNTANISFPSNVGSDAFTVQNRNPGSVSLVVEQKLRREVPVVISYVGTVQEDFIADKDNALLDYTTVTIEGPASAVEQITQAVIEVDLHDKSESFNDSYTYTLCDAAGQPVDAAYVETNIAAVNMTLYIQRIKEIPLVLAIKEGGGATANTAKIVRSLETLKVSGNDAVLAELEQLELGIIDLGTIAENTTLTFPVVLPAGVTNLSNVTEITVDISFPDLATKTVTVTNITAVNVPADMEAEILTKTMQVVIRGPRTVINALTEQEVSVVVDLAGAQIGTFTVKGTLSTTVQYTACGAIKMDSISVTLRSTVEALSDDPDGNG